MKGAGEETEENERTRDHRCTCNTEREGYLAVMVYKEYQVL